MRLEIVPTSTTIYEFDTLYFNVNAYDEDNNLTTNYGNLIWYGGEKIGEIDSISGRFIAQQEGAGKIWVRSSYSISDTIDISVLHKVEPPAYFEVKIANAHPLINEVYQCSLIVLDRFNRRIDEFEKNKRKIFKRFLPG